MAGGQHLRDLGVAGQPHRLLSPPRPQDRGGVNNCDLNGHRFYNIRSRLRLMTNLGLPPPCLHLLVPRVRAPLHL